ncbi:MAG: hypothetical protein ACR2FE_06085 [Aeromicrobium sp.]
MEMMTFSVLVVLGLVAAAVVFVGGMLAVRILGQRNIDAAAPRKQRRRARGPRDPLP